MRHKRDSILNTNLLEIPEIRSPQESTAGVPTTLGLLESSQSNIETSTQATMEFGFELNERGERGPSCPIVSSVPTLSAKVSLADSTAGSDISLGSSASSSLSGYILPSTDVTEKGERIRSDPSSEKPATKVLASDSSKIHSSTHDSTTLLTGKRKSRSAGPLKKRARVKTCKEPTLLAQPGDEKVLNTLHCFIRQQIQVFTATDVELALPAPGRKNQIQVGQVGLRCIHCARTNVRVKRAVCYPSSVSRIYNTVSDMKFDHFGMCPNMPESLQAQYAHIRATCTKPTRKPSSKGSSTTSTAQHYLESAVAMGMKDGAGGVVMGEGGRQKVPSPVSPAAQAPIGLSALSPFIGGNMPTFMNHTLIAPNPFICPPIKAAEVSQPGTPKTSSLDTVLLLSTDADDQNLNPLHCFVRRYIEVFQATQHDIGAPAPGRKTPVQLGQVGLRCVHCACLPSKERVKRAVCYPPSVNGIYHAVSNMKFDHFGNCKGLPQAAREEFNQLRTSHGRRQKKGMANSTVQFYHDSAVGLNLVDTSVGIRMGSSETLASKKEPIPRGLSALVMAATDPSLNAIAV